MYQAAGYTSDSMGSSNFKQYSTETLQAEDIL